jgi:AmmeMemoRadiSam system protein B
MASTNTPIWQLYKKWPTAYSVRYLSMSYVREMTHGGDWYPKDQTLEQMMKASFYYAPVTEAQKENLVGIIAPHSCYSVCLRTGAKSYARIDPDKYDKIIILGTCHHIPLAKILVSDASEVVTPFGNIPLDIETCKALCEDNPDFFSLMTKEVDEAEHSLEMQYPLIKWVFGNRSIQIIPMLVGSLNEDRETGIVAILKPLILAERTLFIISSDFTHWGEMFKFTPLQNMRKPLSAQLRLWDEKAMNIIGAFNYSHFRFHIEDVKGSICGCYAICLIMHILKSGYAVDAIDRTELCQITCPSDFSISYMAVGFYVKTDVPEEEENDNGIEISEELLNSLVKGL